MFPDNISPRITVALAVYNGEKYLQELLQSLEQQELKPFEIVVLDDCSSDSSADIIRNFSFSVSQLLYHRNEKNEGVSATFKKIISLCTGDYIAFCDQDDIWMPHKLKITYAAHQRFTTTPAVIFTDLTLVDDFGKTIDPSFWKYVGLAPHKTNFFDVLFGNVITGCTVLINRQMIELLKQMPTEAIMYDHWIALIAYGFGDYGYIEKPTIYYRVHNNSVTSKQKAFLFERIYKGYNNRNSFLKTNFLQAEVFKNLYGGILNENNRTALDYFLGLQQSTFFTKWMVSRLRKNPWKKLFYPLFHSVATAKQIDG